MEETYPTPALSTLLSMRSFVLHLKSMTTTELCTSYPKCFVAPVWKGNQCDAVKDFLRIDAILWRLVGNYAKFLSKKLELYLIVPCSKSGEVLTMPKYYSYWKNGESNATREVLDKCQEYKTALDMVLFDGFAWNAQMKSVFNAQSKYDCRIDLIVLERMTVEDLTLHIHDLKLTQKSLTEIFN